MQCKTSNYGKKLIYKNELGSNHWRVWGREPQPTLFRDATKTGKGEQGTGNRERGTENGERRTENGERGTGNGERETGNGKRGTGTSVQR